jgi:hypothetical protein
MELGFSLSSEEHRSNPHRYAPRCSPDERLEDVAVRMAAGWTWCAVVIEAGILLGRLRRRQLDANPEATAEEAMENGPSTYRPSTPAAELAERMKSGRFEPAFVHGLRRPALGSGQPGGLGAGGW